MGSISFFSSCPACKHARLQNGYTRSELTAALRTGDAIDAYCLMCDVVWSIRARERFMIASQLGGPARDARVPAAQTAARPA